MLPPIKEMLNDKLGSDVLDVIMDYFGNIKMTGWELFVEDILCNSYGIEIAHIVLLYVVPVVYKYCLL